MDECTEHIDDRPTPDLATFTATEVLKAGLDLIFSAAKIARVKGDPHTSKTNIQRFKDHCGANPAIISLIWSELQTTSHSAARIKVLKFDHFLESLNFLYRYHREAEREGQFDKSPKTLRKWNWYYLLKTQALKSTKIVFPPTEEFGDDIWVMSVDGVHSEFKEIGHHEFSQNRRYFSHKKKHAGLCHELGIHLFESKLIWMNGSFPAGPNDKGNFVNEGLRDKLASIGKKAVGDKGYTGYPDVCSTFNAFDSTAVKKFKSRAQMRHEQFNGMLKEFSTLDNQFRHDQDKFEVCFEAACVICQYRLENGEPLFDILAGIEFEDEAESDVDSEEERSDNDNSEEEESDYET